MALELGHSTGSIGGEEALGQGVIDTMKLVVDKVRGVIVPGKGHWLAEQEPQQLVDVLTPFLALYRDAELRPLAHGLADGTTDGLNSEPLGPAELGDHFQRHGRVALNGITSS